jgi:hypothetical protein
MCTGRRGSLRLAARSRRADEPEQVLLQALAVSGSAVDRLGQLQLRAPRPVLDQVQQNVALLQFPRPIAGSRNIEARPVPHLERRRERFGERSQMPTVDG